MLHPPARLPHHNFPGTMSTSPTTPFRRTAPPQQMNSCIVAYRTSSAHHFHTSVPQRSWIPRSHNPESCVTIDRTADLNLIVLQHNGMLARSHSPVPRSCATLRLFPDNPPVLRHTFPTIPYALVIANSTPQKVGLNWFEITTRFFDLQPPHNSRSSTHIPFIAHTPATQGSSNARPWVSPSM